MAIEWEGIALLAVIVVMLAIAGMVASMGAI